MTAFTHLILTRFNLRLWANVRVDDAWLQTRRALFERFCYPSVRGQTETRFRWLAFLEEDSPDWLRAAAAEWAVWPAFQPVYVAGRDLAAMQRAIAAAIEPGSTHLITTTLDNDDAPAREYTARIQAEFRGQRFELVNFPHGLRLDTRRRKLYACTIPTNPFISLIERIEDGRFLSVLGCLPHSTIPERFGNAVRDVDAPPLWLQVAHGGNLDPTGGWGRQREPLQALQSFALAETWDTQRESRWGIALDRLRGTAERQLIDRTPAAWKAWLRDRLKARRLFGR